MNQKTLILDIAMNLNRIGNWTADGYKTKQKRIKLFLTQTSNCLKSLETSTFPEVLQKTFTRFLDDYSKLEKEGIVGPQDELEWAEKMMTWGNILTHRSRLL